jgi:hypothetical protein|eukprot:COSAG02_NODE_747_length_17723_cov_49.509816_11_plen_105_part_00
MDVEGLFYLFVLLLGFYSAFLVRISTPACTVMRGVRLSPGVGGAGAGERSDTPGEPSLALEQPASRAWSRDPLRMPYVAARPQSVSVVDDAAVAGLFGVRGKRV